MKGVAKTTGILAMVAFLATLAGCCPCRKLATSDSTATKDSSNVEIRWREVRIHDSVPFYIPIERKSSVGMDSSYLKTQFAKSSAWTDSTGRLHHTLENIPQQVNLPYDGSVLVSDTNTYESHSSVKDNSRIEYVEKELTKWQKFQMNAFWWLAVGLAGFILWNARKWWMKWKQNG